MSKQSHHDFGIVEENGEIFEFHCESEQGAMCRLELFRQTERGSKRTELAIVPVALWRKLSVRVIKELTSGMVEKERAKKNPSIKFGINRLGPLLGRELAVLFWALMEDSEATRVEGILHGWRELAREERWWLYTKAIAPGQNIGLGWRRAIFLALSEPFESRSFESKVNESLKYVAGSKSGRQTGKDLRVTEKKQIEKHQVCRDGSEASKITTAKNSEGHANKNNRELDKSDFTEKYIQTELF